MMRWGAVIGLLIAFGGILCGQVIEGGRIGSLSQASAFLIVFCGTVGAVLVQSGVGGLLVGVRMSSWIVRPPADDREKLILLICHMGLIARREGLIEVEKLVSGIDDEFLKRAALLIADGIDGARLGEILDTEIDAVEVGFRNASKVWESAGGYSPTIGILGAVLGLIHVMENLSDPSKLGPGIAVAFVATIYGVGLANLVFLPVANSLKKITAREINRLEMVAAGCIGVVTGENSVFLEARMRAFG